MDQEEEDIAIQSRAGAASSASDECALLQKWHCASGDDNVDASQHKEQNPPSAQTVEEAVP